MTDTERRLRAAAHTLAELPVPDVTARVRAAVTTDPAAASTARKRRLVPVAVAALALAIGGALVLVPSAGVAVADFLGLDALRIRLERRMPPVADALRLGERVTLERARDSVPFRVAVPRTLGAPDEVWLDADAVPGGQVTLLWRPSDTLPASGPHGVGVLLTVLPGSFDPGLLAKSVWSDATELTSVSLGDGQGWWISGEAHALVYLDARGAPRRETSRLAGDTLLWQSGEVLYRLESGLPLPRALEVARSLR